MICTCSDFEYYFLTRYYLTKQMYTKNSLVISSIYLTTVLGEELRLYWIVPHKPKVFIDMWIYLPASPNTLFCLPYIIYKRKIVK